MTVSKSVRQSTPSAGRTAEWLPLPYRLLFLVSHDCPPWFRQLHDNLAQVAAHTSVCTDTDPIDETISRFQPDAIVGYGSETCVNLFTAFALVEPLHRPLCVLVDAADDSDNKAPADLVSLPVMRPLQRQLLGMMRLRIELRKANAENDKLRRDANRQQRRAATRHRQLERNSADVEAAHASELQQVIAALTELQAKWDAQETRVRQLEREAADHGILKQAIFGNVTHEFSTPLLQVKSAVKVLSEEFPGHSVINMAIESLAKLEASVQNMTQLASSLDIELAPVVMREVIDGAVRKVENSLMHKDSADRVRLHITDRLPPVMGHSQSLVAAVQRLIDNGLKFSKKTPVDVSLGMQDNMVVVSVRDYGIGIAPEHLPRIYDMFYQVDGSSTRHYPGMGIGLAIVRTILDKHGVHIEIDSEPGRGTTVLFRMKPVNLRTDRPNHFKFDDA